MKEMLQEKIGFDHMTTLFCETCGNKNGFMQDIENGELVCKSCGLVISDDINIEKVPRGNFNKQMGRFVFAQHGAYMTGMFHDYGMSTIVGQFIDLARLSPEQRNQFYRLRRWQGRTRIVGSRDRNLVIALGFLAAMCDELTIPRSVKEYAAKTYRMAFDARIVTGRSISHIAAASLYFACRMHGVTRTIKDIASTNVLKPEAEKFRKFEIVIARTYRLLHKRMNLKPPNASPLQLVAKICSQLDLPSIVEEYAVELLMQYSDKKLSAGKSPRGLVATAIYITGRQLGIKITQANIAKATQVSEVTIRTRYKEMVEALNIDDAPNKKYIWFNNQVQ